MKIIVGILLFCTFLFIDGEVRAQNLMNERIRKVTSRKRSIYLDQGIFHNGNQRVPSQVKSLRHSFSKRRGYERLVMDFKSEQIPRVYGYFNTQEKKIYIDLFDTSLSPQLKSLGKAKFVEGVNFLPLDKESLSVEITLKKKVALDIFFLEKPGRLVIDIKD